MRMLKNCPGPVLVDLVKKQSQPTLKLLVNFKMMKEQGTFEQGTLWLLLYSGLCLKKKLESSD